jgi:TonB family protein
MLKLIIFAYVQKPLCMENPHHKKKKFLNLPTYPGGRDAFRKFIGENLVYPPLALQNKIEGTVFLSYVVNDMGEVIDAKVHKGIGYGCDEEALRLIRLLHYGKVNNRGLRVRSEMKTGIRFVLPANVGEVIYSYISAPPVEKKPEVAPAPSYNYTITLNS